MNQLPLAKKVTKMYHHFCMAADSVLITKLEMTAQFSVQITRCKNKIIGAKKAANSTVEIYKGALTNKIN